MITSPKKSLRISYFLGLLLPFSIASGPLSAQSPSVALSQAQSAAQPPLRFEVVAIYPHRLVGDESSNRRVLPGGRFVATTTTVRTLLRIAFATDDNRMSGAPGWIDSETFDINATTAGRAEIKTPEQFQQVILSLLEDRFQLKFHREPKEVPVYWLELNKAGKPGPGLKLSASDAVPNMSTNSNGLQTEMKASKMSMVDVAAALRRLAGRPVEDHTGLAGNFDFKIEWAPEETAESTDPSLFTVLKEQLGLKLRPAKGTIETLVIDQISQPSAN
jgi:uncharacterized protein (TIGR03435 family)